MKSIFITIIVLFFLAVFFGNKENSCLLAQESSKLLPKRLVIIKGKATIINHPDLGETPATSETLIFQKIGCESCFIGTNVDQDGNYKILVSDGKYKIIVRNPSSPEKDLLDIKQEKFIDTGSENSPNSTFNFDIKIKFPE